MTVAAPSLKELARACLARHRGAARPPCPAAAQPDPGGGPAARCAARDDRAHFDERAAIAERDGGQDRATAERLASGDGIAEWLNRNPPMQADPYRCLHCGQPEGAGGALLPVLTGAGGHVWIHDLCYPDWMRRRWAAAAKALTALAVAAPARGPARRGDAGRAGGGGTEADAGDG